jgi:hypothetical protein
MTELRSILNRYFSLLSMVAITFVVIGVGFLCIPWLLARGGYILMLCILTSSLGELVSIAFVFVLTCGGTSRAPLSDGIKSTIPLVEDHPTPLPKFAPRSRSSGASKAGAPVIQISHNDVIIVNRLPVGDHSTQGVWLAAEELVMLWSREPVG